MKTLSFILLLLLFVSCQSDKSSENVIIKPTLALLYCDMSKSGNDNAVSQIHRKVMNVYDNLPYGSELEIHALNYPGSSKLLVSFAKPNEKPNRDVPSENDKHKLLLSNYRKTINDNLLDTLQSIYELDDGKRNSCILNVFESANDIFMSKDESWNKELYLFSDFIEDCSNSINGGYLSIYDANRLESTLNVIRKWSPSQYNNETKIKFIHTDNTDVNRKISYTELKEFWNEVYMKVQTTDSLYFSPRVGT